MPKLTEKAIDLLQTDGQKDGPTLIIGKIRLKKILYLVQQISGSGGSWRILIASRSVSCSLISSSSGGGGGNLERGQI